MIISEIKNIKIQTILLIGAILLVNCKQRETNNIVVDKFPQTVSLSGKFVKEVKLLDPRGLFIVDSFLIMSSYNREFFFQVYSTNTHKLLAEFGNKGRGPGEFITPEFTGQVSFDNQTKKPIVHVYDIDRRMLSCIGVYKDINQKGFIVSEERLPTNIKTSIKKVFFINDSCIIGVPEIEGRFFIYNRKSSSMKIVPYLPDLKIDERKRILTQIYYSSYLINTEKNIILSVGISLGQIDFFDLNGNYIKSTIFEPKAIENLKKSISSKFKIQPKMYIGPLLSVGSFIYGLNFNSSDYGDDEKNSFSKIDVFDWSGQPVKEYILDRNVLSFALDTIHKKIYALGNNEENPLIVYDFEK